MPKKMKGRIILGDPNFPFSLIWWRIGGFRQIFNRWNGHHPGPSNHPWRGMC